MQEHFNLAIVGHVDHGKSTLIGRILYDTHTLPLGKMEEINAGKSGDIELAHLIDSLEEERTLCCTIDTSQTFFRTDKRRYVIIDTPGHREFIRNMITGASQAEAAIIIIDVGEGIREQTARHAYIISMLGIQQLIVVINKMDLVGYDRKAFNSVKDQAIKMLNELNLNPAHLIPISAKNGDNVAELSDSMPWYKGQTVLKALDSLERKPERTNLPLRMPVQDIYETDNKKIVVGRIESGSVKTGQKILLMPENRETSVRSIEVYLRKKRNAVAGESMGVTLAGSIPVQRGSVICSINNKPHTTTNLNANLFWMSDKRLKKGEILIMRCNTQETECRVVNIQKRIDTPSLKVLEKNASLLRRDEMGEVVIQTNVPVVADEFGYIPEMGRFVLERGPDTVAAGIITSLRA